MSQCEPGYCENCGMPAARTHQGAWFCNDECIKKWEEGMVLVREMREKAKIHKETVRRLEGV